MKTILAIIGAIFLLILALIGLALRTFFNGSEDDDYEHRAYPRNAINPEPNPEDIIGDGARPTESEMKNAAWQKPSM